METVSRRVWKAWDDEGFPFGRPGAVVVELLCDGQVYDTQMLSPENNWQYIWKALPARDSAGRLLTWALRERAVEGYTATIWAEGDTFLVRNTYTGKKLPQTGLIWWPAAVLSAAGLILMGHSLFLKKKK